MGVAVGSILSVIDYILSINIFTLVSWVSLIGFAFKFLRKEYLIWSGSGVMDMQDDDDIIPLLRNKEHPSTKCETCGQTTYVHTVPRPKVLCTKAVFYIYIILSVVFIMLIAGSILGAIAFPVYALYVGPYLPTHHNLNTFSNQPDRSFTQLLQDSYLYNNFTTDALHVPDNYRTLLNYTLVEGLSMYSQCNVHIQDGKALFTILQDIENLMDNREEVIKTLPPIADILSGLNATFYPYLAYMPSNVPLVKDAIDFFNTGNYSYAALEHFTNVHHIFTRDPLQIRIIEIPDVLADPLSLINLDFRNDIMMIVHEITKNVTDVSLDIAKKSTDMYNRLYLIATGFFKNEDLSQFAEIPLEFVEMFTILQSKISYYYDIWVKVKSVLPDFMMCMREQSAVTVNKLKNYMTSSYFAYFKIHFLYTIAVIVIILGLIVGFVLFLIRGFKLAKETMNYAKSLITAASVETIDAINDFGRAVNKRKEEYPVCLNTHLFTD